jgi:hypothetical protein
MNKSTAEFCLKIIAISFFGLSARGEAKEKIITVCGEARSTYFHINTEFSQEKKDETFLEIDKKDTGEKYVLSKLTTIENEEDRLIFFSNRYYNISYISSKFPLINWSLLSVIREQKTKVEVLNESKPLVIRVYEPRVDEQVYLFNLDSEGNGTMSIVKTRWYSFMNKGNYQSLTHTVCKKP